MLKYLSTIILMLLLISVGCGDSCDNENPSVRLVNSGTEKADVQIKTSGGNTENINNIEPGTSSALRSFAPGEIEFTVTIQGVQDPVVYVLQAQSCNEYSVTINEDNSVTSSGKKLDKTII